MTVRSPHAGTRPEASMLIDVDSLLAAYHDVSPDPADSAQRVSFGTSGHRGTATAGTFNESHVLAITEAICRYRQAQSIAGPLFLGRDTHALSGPAARSAVEVLAAHGVDVRVDAADGPTPGSYTHLTLPTTSRG
jgi:phosphoglucomutase